MKNHILVTNLENRILKGDTIYEGKTRKTEIEVIRFEEKDVIATSDGYDETGDIGGEGFIVD